MIPPIEDSILKSNPKFSALHATLSNKILNSSGSTTSHPAQKERDAVTAVPSPSDSPQVTSSLTSTFIDPQKCPSPRRKTPPTPHRSAQYRPLARINDSQSHHSPLKNALSHTITITTSNAENLTRTTTRSRRTHNHPLRSLVPAYHPRLKILPPRIHDTMAISPQFPPKNKPPGIRIPPYAGITHRTNNKSNYERVVSAPDDSFPVINHQRTTNGNQE